MKTFAEKLTRSEKRLREMKGGIEAKVLATDFIFPLFRALGVDTEEALGGLHERLEGVEAVLEDDGAGASFEVLEDSRDIIILLAGMLDRTMVAAGFFEETPKGLRKTDKIPADLAQEFFEVGEKVAEQIKAIEEELENAEEDDDDPDGDPGEPAAVVGSIAPAPLVAADVETPASVAADTGAAAAVAVDAVVVEEGGTAPAAAETTRSTEHDTDAA